MISNVRFLPASSWFISNVATPFSMERTNTRKGWTPAGAHHVHGLPHGKLVAVGNLIHWHRLHHVLVALAVGLGGGDVHGLRLAHGHVLQGVVEAEDHLAGHARELDGLAAIHRGV